MQPPRGQYFRYFKNSVAQASIKENLLYKNIFIKYPYLISLKKLELDTNFPVIVYHHGNQGPSDENYLMAEYFASRGYIFVSANFELPFANHSFGYREGNIKKPNTSTPKKLIEFAKSISSSEQLFYVGHSYGAQVGFCILHEEGLADAFVSMETTMEFGAPVLLHIR